MKLLMENFRPENLKSVMCRAQVSVGWEGNLYNCDFNQACHMPITDKEGKIMTSKDLPAIFEKEIEIQTGPHCYGCVALIGSSCMGTLT
jgi:hypothetical protein